jgi:hypothetical protein
VKGYGSLLILRYLMREIQRLEEDTRTEGGVHPSSFHPFSIKNAITEETSGELRPGATDLGMEMGGQQEIPNIPAVRSRRFPWRKKVEPATEENLKELLKPKWEGYLPCHYFDYIGGTSTGGSVTLQLLSFDTNLLSLNALMLGRLRMSVDQCIESYSNMAARIFSFPRFQLKGWPRSKYDSTRLEREIKQLVATRLDREGHNVRKAWELFPSPDDLCRT